MCNIELEKYQGRIKAAYEASAFTEGVKPEPEEDIKKVRSKLCLHTTRIPLATAQPRRLLFGRTMDF